MDGIVMHEGNRPKAKEGRKLRAIAVDLLLMTGLWLCFVLIACSTAEVRQQTNVHPSQAHAINPTVEAASPEKLPLRTLTDVPLTGGTTRFDCQSLDTDNGQLYIAHLGSDLLTVVDVNKQTVIGYVKDLKRGHGVLAVPALHRVLRFSYRNKWFGRY